MNCETPSGVNSPGWWRRVLWLLVLAALPAGSYGLTVLPFDPVRDPLTNEIATLSAITNPTRVERLRLRTLTRATKVLSNSSLKDGAALRRLKNTLGRFPEYMVPLDSVASNLVEIFTSEYNFVDVLLMESPPSEEASAVRKQYERLAPAVLKLTATVNARKTSALYDPAKRRLDNIQSRANGLLTIPFPEDLPTMNQIKALIDGTSFTTSATAASQNLFSAVVGETNIAIAVSAIDYPRGILFSIPNVRFGTFRYPIPASVSFTNRTGVYTPGETMSGATNGNFFISTTSTEVYGIFECTGPDFSLVKGRFRIDLSSRP